MKPATRIIVLVFCAVLMNLTQTNGLAAQPVRKQGAKTDSKPKPQTSTEYWREYAKTHIADPPTVGSTGQLNYNLTIVQVVDENNAVCRFGTGGELMYWFVMPTTNLVDGEMIDTGGQVFTVTGTKTYTTILGATKKVYVFERATALPNVAKPAAEAKARHEDAARQQRIENAKWRTWTAANGKHRVAAKFVKVTNGVLTLETKDRRTIEVPLAQLLPNDQEFVRLRKWMKPETTEPQSTSTPPPPATVAKAVPEVAPKAANTDTRTRWLNESYGTTIYQVNGKDWAELENATQKIRWTLTETVRTDEYIELYNATRNQNWRLMAEKMDLKEGEQWKWVSTGHWHTPDAHVSAN